jgi:hypothetical protein
MPKRLLVYILESYQPQFAVFTTFLMCFALFTLFRTAAKTTICPFDGSILIATVVLNLFLLYARVTDEFKDIEIDKKYFPHRPLPSGKVKTTDLLVLKYSLMGTLFLIGIVFYKIFIGFLVVFALFFLMGNYFYIPRILEKNRILALITHSPALLILCSYLAALYADYHHVPVQAGTWLIIAMWIYLPEVIWEFSRKTRSPEEERAGYQTYSAMLGPRWPAFIAMLLMIIHVGILSLFSRSWQISRVILSAIYMAAFIFIAFYAAFIRRPAVKTNRLKAISESYWVISNILVVINGLVFIT